ncbi:MAG: D-alanyl-D-alanine carboxypeptidase/D-alanyl-D-alanine-endopeptidase [Ignavibacteriales bacterium]|nr:D-alanyl-D-alanine carboxypeptidase/D-alanyl-D-alanine-endopeptidase [Ignavibacteriales bacterium]
MKKITILFNFLLFFSIGCSTDVTSVKTNNFQNLKLQITEIFDDPRFENAFWGVLIQSLETGEIWYARNPNKLFMPASNEKIPTSATALLNLGPDFTFTSTLSYAGEIKDSILFGDLIVWSNGDPTMYNRFYSDARDVFWQWADSLKKLGIKKITGNVIGDDNAFDDEPFGDGWSFDGLDVWYSAEIGALQLNENCVDLKIFPPKDNFNDVKIIPNLQSNYYKIFQEIEIIDSGRTSISVTRKFGTNDILIKGKLVKGSNEFERTPSITNPTLFYVTVLKETFEEKGILIDGKPIDCDEINYFDSEYTEQTILIEHQSAPLKDILAGLMKRSQNLYAETIAKLLGWKEYKLGSFSNGRNVVEKTLEKMGIEKGTYQYRDGSGLTRYNYISPEQIVKILTYMHNSEYWPIWYNIQSIAGVDGTLRNRMKETKCEGNVHAKTGTISNVRALSGYVTTADREMLAFSFLVNSYRASSQATEELTDGVLELLANFKK